MTQTGALGRILMVKRMELRFVLKDLKIVIMYSAYSTNVILNLYVIIYLWKTKVDIFKNLHTSLFHKIT